MFALNVARVGVFCRSVVLFVLSSAACTSSSSGPCEGVEHCVESSSGEVGCEDGYVLTQDDGSGTFRCVEDNCAVFSRYDDGVCDICPRPDPDCAATSVTSTDETEDESSVDETADDSSDESTSAQDESNADEDSESETSADVSTTGDAEISGETGDDDGSSRSVVVDDEDDDELETECEPTCGAAVCGVDPLCGEPCGTCDDFSECDEGQCVPICETSPVELDCFLEAPCTASPTDISGTWFLAFAPQSGWPGSMTMTVSQSGSELEASYVKTSANQTGSDFSGSVVGADLSFQTTFNTCTMTATGEVESGCVIEGNVTCYSDTTFTAVRIE